MWDPSKGATGAEMQPICRSPSAVSPATAVVSVEGRMFVSGPDTDANAYNHTANPTSRTLIMIAELGPIFFALYMYGLTLYEYSQVKNAHQFSLQEYWIQQTVACALDVIWMALMWFLDKQVVKGTREEKERLQMYPPPPQSPRGPAIVLIFHVLALSMLLRINAASGLTVSEYTRDLNFALSFNGAAAVAAVFDIVMSFYVPGIPYASHVRGVAKIV